MARGREKGHPPISLLLVILVAVAVLAGCTGGQDSTQGPAGGDDEPSDETQSEPVPEDLVPDEVEPGVQLLDELVFADGGALGYVYDDESRKPMAGVTVVAQCLIAGVDLPLSPRIAETDDAGRFELRAGGGLIDCDEVTYQALEPGYAQVEDAISEPLVPGKQYLVLIAMRPIDARLG